MRAIVLPDYNANIIRAMLEMRGLSEGQDPMRSRELEAVLGSGK